jgi:lysosomal acid lipase/cholesteryl ester hydrolase
MTVVSMPGVERRHRDREIPLFTLEGVGADVTTHPFTTEDMLGLSMLRFTRKPCEDVVVIIHGLTTSTDMFIMPEHRNLVTCLLDAGFTDVFSIDFRMSNRHPYNLQPHRYSFDDCALYDFPAAFRAIRQIAGDRRIHVICHCLGSVSFLMSLFGGATRGISSVIANSVGLTPRVPRWSQVKLQVAPFLLEQVMGFPYISPAFSRGPLPLAKAFSYVNSLMHRECDVPACHMLSLMWGTGWPALYSHENLHDVTHRRGGDLYGGTAVNYYRHVLKMVRAGNRAVKYEPRNPKYDRLPDDYLAEAGGVTTPILFVTGADNRVFTDSNILCYRTMEELAPGRHSLHVFPGYGHQDVFMGKDVDRDIFPTFLEYLERQRRSTRRSA